MSDIRLLLQRGLPDLKKLIAVIAILAGWIQHGLDPSSEAYS